MTFLKRNLHDILRLYINQIGITIFALMLYTACGATDDNRLFSQLRTIVSVFSILFYLVLIYYISWENGAKDKIRVDGGRMQPTPYRGLLCSLCANVPNLILSISTLVVLIIQMNSPSALSLNLFSILVMLMMGHASMYMGLIQTITYGLSVPTADVIDFEKYLEINILYIFVPLISVAVTHFAYYLGYREIKIVSIFGIKKK